MNDRYRNQLETTDDLARPDTRGGLASRRRRLTRAVLVVLSVFVLAGAIVVADAPQAEAGVLGATPRADCGLNAHIYIDPGLAANPYWSGDRFTFSYRLEKWTGKRWVVVKRKTGVRRIDSANEKIYVPVRRSGYYRIRAGFAWNSHAISDWGQVATWSGRLYHAGFSARGSNGAWCNFTWLG